MGVLLIEGEDEFDQALNLAGSRRNLEPLIGMLLDPDRELSMVDRRRLVSFIEGHYRNPRGRRPPEKRLIGESGPTSIQQAAAAVDRVMATARQRGWGIKGRLPIVQRRVARLFAVTEDEIINCRKRSKNPRLNR